MLRVDDLDTPVVTCDLDLLQKNIDDMAAVCREVGIPMRSHTKSHKIPEIAHMQMRAGNVGICCQKLGDAEVMVASGLSEILIPFNIWGASKVERLTRLVRRANVTVAVDSAEVARGIAIGAQQAGVTVPIIIEMDTGGRRAGVQSPDAARRLGRAIADMPGVELRGVMTYPSRTEAKPFLDEVRDGFQKDGLPLDTISGGGTGHEAISKELGCTETRSGSYVWEGLRRVQSSADLAADRCPMKVICTVVSVPTPERCILDGGIKTFGLFPRTPTPECLMVEHPKAKLWPFSIEHTTVDTSECDHQFKVGERVSVIPRHGEVCLNLHDELHGVRHGNVEIVWEVAGRGRIR
jgi:D-serine deaminase-like pyridoxal phosphate-dependent protein